jgi:hypothetical protein
MRRRTRSLIGTIVMLAFIIIYAPLAMALADSRISETPAPVQAVLYALLGIAWIFPLMPLISRGSGLRAREPGRTPGPARKRRPASGFRRTRAPDTRRVIR